MDEKTQPFSKEEAIDIVSESDNGEAVVHEEKQLSGESTLRPQPYLIPVSIIIAGIIIAGAIVYALGSKSVPSPTALVPTVPPGLELREQDIVLGDANAPVTIVEYADFQCPFCARFFHGAMSEIRRNYVENGKVKMVFRNFQFLGPESSAAGEAAQCAADQGRFWEYHDEIFVAESIDGVEHNGNLNRALFVKIASDLGLDAGAFTTCIDSGTHTPFIQAERTAAASLGVNSTPTVFVNGKMILGAQPFATFQAAIEEALASEK